MLGRGQLSQGTDSRGMTSTLPKQKTRAVRKDADLQAELDSRNAQLAVVSAISEALAKQLTFQEIVDAVGDRLSEIFNSGDMFIAIVDESRGMIEFPYWTESGKRDPNVPPIKIGEGLTSQIIASGKPLRMSTAAGAEALGAVSYGEPMESFLGVPIPVGDRMIGVLSLSAKPAGAFSEADERLVSTVASSMGVALESARRFDETKRLLGETEQRAGELAIINEVGAALAEQLDFDAIVDLVGDRLSAMFKSQDFYIALVDRSRNQITFPYELDNGKRVHGDPIEFGQGVTSHVIQERRAYRFDTTEEQNQHGGLPGTYAEHPEGVPLEELTQSWLGVPIMAAREAIGVVVLGDRRPYMFSDADERLVSTVASSMGVALENARLFDETKHLLAQTEQQNAELAVVNEIGEALAKQLDFQGIIDAVGDRIRAIFDVPTELIILYDADTETLTFPYAMDHGERVQSPPSKLSGLSEIVITSRRPLRIASSTEAMALGAVTIGDGDIGESWLGVPVFAGDRVLGLIGLERLHRDGFDESDERLLSTIAQSMGVAVENARLFDETKRLLAETEQRNAELAVINEIGEALSRQLDFQGIIDAVGDRIRSIFNVQTGTIALYDSITNLVTTPYSIDLGERIEQETMELKGLTAIVVGERRPLRLGSNEASDALDAVITGSDEAESWLGVPITAGDRVLGSISLERLPKNAFSESDERLLATIASNLGVALENARLFDETKRLLAETEQRNAELAVVNEISAALSKKLEYDAIIDAVGDKISEVLGSQDLTIAILDEESGLINSPYWTEDGIRDRTIPPMKLGEGLTSRILASGLPLRLGTFEEAVGLGARLSGNPGDIKQSFLGVPIPGGDRMIGVLTLGKGPPNAFSEADEQLVSTIASSMGVALENARLFDETKRLLAETNERAAELAIINSVQQSLASKLDMESMYELVGEKIAETIHVPTMTIVTYDLERGETTTRFLIERGVRDRQGQVSPMSGFARLPRRAWPADPGQQRHHGLARRARFDGDRQRRRTKVVGLCAADARWPSRWRPVATERRPRGRVQRERSATGGDAGLESQRRARKRAPVRRNATTPYRNQRARRRAGDHQQRPGRPRSQTRHAVDVRPRGRQDHRDIRRADSRHRPIRP